MCAGGLGRCVELMGVFSSAHVQRAAATVCARLAFADSTVCEALLGADVTGMLLQHIKAPDTTLQAFEDSARIVTAICRHDGLVRFHAHLCMVSMRVFEQDLL
jgi:hypothetical protein